MDRADYPDLEASSQGKWVRCIAGAMTDAALMAFVVNCSHTDGGILYTPGPYDSDGAADVGADADSRPNDLGE